MTDLDISNTEDKIHTDTSNWTPTKKKRLQHMTEFHEEYQWIFGEKASICTIMKRRISHMNPPILDTVCKEEMQNTNVDTNEFIIEYIKDAQGNKIKKLKPLRQNQIENTFNTYIVMITILMFLNISSLKKREVTIDSYSETISSDSSSDDSTILLTTVTLLQVLRKQLVCGKLILRE